MFHTISLLRADADSLRESHSRMVLECETLLKERRTLETILGIPVRGDGTDLVEAAGKLRAERNAAREALAAAVNTCGRQGKVIEAAKKMKGFIPFVEAQRTGEVVFEILAALEEYERKDT
jgi:hypothetical protein